jgi:hypothetical protein
VSCCRRGRDVPIRGPVAGTYYAVASNGSPTFLNLGVDYPNPRRTTIVIWRENRAAFGAPERRYRGHTVCVRGRVDLYRGVPEIRGHVAVADLRRSVNRRVNWCQTPRGA